MDRIEASGLIELFSRWNDVFTGRRTFLIELDGTVGDSDLGITMNKAFAAAAEAVASQGKDAGIAQLLRIAGTMIARAAPSTMGTLTAIGFLRGSKALEGSEAIGTTEAARFWRAYRDGIAERGKARLGDKTVLDVLDPIAVALERAVQENQPLGAALAVSSKAAAEALQRTKTMTAQHGKAAAFAGKTVGLQDAGATVGLLMIECMRDFVVN